MANAQVTWMEVKGTEWFETSRDADIPAILNLPNSLFRFQAYHIGFESSQSIKTKVDSKCLPIHFGYIKHKSASQALDFSERYGLDKVTPLFFSENVRSKVHQWTKADFAKLKADQTVIQIYVNGEFEVWRVYGK